MKKEQTGLSSIGRLVFDKVSLLPNQIEVVDKGFHHVQSFLHTARHGFKEEKREWFEEMNQPTQVVSILGPRGSGKSACLLSLCKLLDDEKSGEGERKPFFVLPAIIPESLTGTESLLQVLATSILRMVTDYEERALGSRTSQKSDSSRAAEDIRSNLSKVLTAENANTTHGVGLVHDVSGDIDSFSKRMAGYHTIFSRRVSIVHNSIVLLLDHIVRADLLVVPMDDVDLARQRNEEALELIKVFLSHPRVAVVFTADLPTMRRAIRNRLLHDLPAVFTGNVTGESEKGAETGFAALFGSKKATMVATEYTLDDAYAQSYLFKVLPPAFRCDLQSVNPWDRLNMKFSMDAKESSSKSIADLMSGLPLLSDMLIEEAVNAEALLGAMSNFSAKYQNSENWMVKTLRNYPLALSPHLRPLINQLVYFSSLVAEHARGLKSIQQPPPDNSTVPPEHLVSYDTKYSIPWSKRIEEMRSNSKQVERICELESKTMMNLIRGLALHPDIEADKPLFGTKFQVNMLSAGSIDEFWHLMTTDHIAAAGSGPLGARFRHIYPGGRLEEFLDSTNALIAFVAEYALRRSERFWFVMTEIGININEQWGFNIVRLKFFDTMGVTCGDEQLHSLQQHVALTTRFTPSMEKVDQLNFAPRSLRWAPPLFLESVREASGYDQSCLHSRVLQENGKRIDWINNRYVEGRKPAESNEETKSSVPKKAASLSLESELALRWLGVLSMRGIEELVGLHNVLLPEQKIPLDVARSHNNTTLPWLIGKDRLAIWNAQNLLAKYKPESPQSILLLLYMASNPIGVALTGCFESDEYSVETLLSKCLSVFSHAIPTIKGEFVRYEPNCQKNESGWTKNDPSKPAFDIRWISGKKVPVTWERFTTDAPVCDMEFLFECLSSFLNLLYSMLNRETLFDSDGCPTLWRQWVENAVTETVIEQAEIASDES